MKKLSSFIIIAAMTAAMLPGISVQAAEANEPIGASEAACIKNESGTLSAGTINKNQANIDGDNRADAYVLRVTSNATPQYLFLRFDLSDYTGWNVSEANLAFNMLTNNTGSASMINIYAADTLTGALADIPTTYASNASAVTGISDPDNLEDTFYIKGQSAENDGSSASTPYGVRPGIRINRDFTSYIKSRIDAGCDSATIMFEMVNATTSYASLIATVGSAYAPALTITGTPSVTYSRSKSKTVDSTGLISANKVSGELANKSAEVVEFFEERQELSAYRLTDAVPGNTATEACNRLFLQFDISSISNTFNKAEFVALIKNTTTGKVSNIKVYKADGISGAPADIAENYNTVSGLVGSGAAVDTSIGSNLLKTIQVRSTYTGHLYGKEETVDVTSYIKDRISAGETTATVMIEFEAGTDNSAYVAFVAAETGYAPVLRVTEMGLPKTGTAPENDYFQATYVSFAEGTAHPIIALYDTSKNAEYLISATIGEDIVLDGSGQTVTVGIKVPEGTDYSTVSTKFFLWDDNLTPYYTAE